VTDGGRGDAARSSPKSSPLTIASWRLTSGPWFNVLDASLDRGLPRERWWAHRCARSGERPAWIEAIVAGWSEE